MEKEFLLAFSITDVFEGGFVNDPDDLGGMTYRGVSRRFFPSWAGWKIIDSVKDKSSLGKNGVLTGLVQQFYYENFWVKIGGNRIEKNTGAKAIIYDTAVNMGIVAAIKFAQEVLNLPKTGRITVDLITKINNLK